MSNGLPQPSLRIPSRHSFSCLASMPPGHSPKVSSSRHSDRILFEHASLLEYSRSCPMLLHRASRSHRAATMLSTALPTGTGASPCAPPGVCASPPDRFSPPHAASRLIPDTEIRPTTSFPAIFCMASPPSRHVTSETLRSARRFDSRRRPRAEPSPTRTAACGFLATCPDILATSVPPLVPRSAVLCDGNILRSAGQEVPTRAPGGRCRHGLEMCCGRRLHARSRERGARPASG
uniref:Uncharacterized protein n=1 Tax=Sorangium cellulosum TaxID=56 RepID=Q9L8B8_SORCE|nr:unknown [Sorangium cellulosum]